VKTTVLQGFLNLKFKYFRSQYDIALKNSGAEKTILRLNLLWFFILFDLAALQL